MRRTEDQEGEFLFALSSLVVGGLSTGIVARMMSPTPVDDLFAHPWLEIAGYVSAALAFTIVGAFVNSFLAGAAVRLAELLDRISSNDFQPWSKAERLSAAKVWLAVLLYWFIVAPIRASVKSVF